MNDPFTNPVILSASKSFASANDLLKSKDPYNLHRTLQQEGYVSVAKSYQNNRPLTTCSGGKRTSVSWALLAGLR